MLVYIKMASVIAAVPWVPTVFSKTDPTTNYAYLARRERRTLFIFNDNEEQFPHSTVRGGGNACVRPLRRSIPPRSAGIPTGSKGRGYATLTPSVRAIIDAAFAIIDWLVLTGNYDRVRYCAGSTPHSFGSNIFKVGDDVMAYICTQIKKRALTN